MAELDPTLAPKSQLDGQLALREDIEKFMGQEDVARVMSFLAHDGSFTDNVYHAGGRNATIAMVEPRPTGYDAVQISGGAFISMGIESNKDTTHGIAFRDPNAPREILPPAQTEKQFTHSYHVAEDGKLVERNDHSPMGSYPQELADRKLAMTVRASKIPSDILIVPKVLGKYEFTGLSDGQGGNATALLFAVPQLGERTDTALVIPIFNAVAQRPELLREALAMYMPGIMQNLSLTGEVAADIHADGLVHNQLTLGNVLALETANGDNLIYVADWETANDIEPKDADLSKALDLTVAFRSFAGTVEALLERSDLTANEAHAICLEGLMVLIAGYRREDPQETYAAIQEQKELWFDALHIMRYGSVKAEEYEPTIKLLQSN